MSFEKIFLFFVFIAVAWVAYKKGVLKKIFGDNEDENETSAYDNKAKKNFAKQPKYSEEKEYETPEFCGLEKKPLAGNEDLKDFLKNIGNIKDELEKGKKLEIDFASAYYLAKHYGDNLTVREDGSVKISKDSILPNENNEIETIVIESQFIEEPAIISTKKNEQIGSEKNKAPNKGLVSELNEFEEQKYEKYKDEPWFIECEYFLPEVRQEYERHPGDWELTTLIKKTQPREGIYRQITPEGYSIRKKGDSVPIESKTWKDIFEEKKKTRGGGNHKVDPSILATSSLPLKKMAEISCSETFREKEKTLDKNSASKKISQYNFSKIIEELKKDNAEMFGAFLNNLFEKILNETNPSKLNFVIYRSNRLVISSQIFSNAFRDTLELGYEEDISLKIKLLILEVKNYYGRTSTLHKNCWYSQSDGNFSFVFLGAKLKIDNAGKSGKEYVYSDNAMAFIYQTFASILREDLFKKIKDLSYFVSEEFIGQKAVDFVNQKKIDTDNSAEVIKF